MYEAQIEKHMWKIDRAFYFLLNRFSCAVLHGFMMKMLRHGLFFKSKCSSTMKIMCERLRWFLCFFYLFVCSSLVAHSFSLCVSFFTMFLFSLLCKCENNGEFCMYLLCKMSNRSSSDRRFASFCFFIHDFFPLLFLQWVPLELLCFKSMRNENAHHTHTQKYVEEINCWKNWIWCESCEMNIFRSLSVRKLNNTHTHTSYTRSERVQKRNSFYLCSRAHKMCLNYDALV